MKIKVIVHARSKAPQTKTASDGILHVYIREPAIEERANKAVIEKLSKMYKIPKSSITLTHGIKSKSKIFEIGH